MHKILRRLYNEIVYCKLFFFSIYYYHKECKEETINDRPSGNFCDLATVSFNNAEVIEYQIRTLRKFFIFPYRYTVFDNSNISKISTKIKKICLMNNVGYVKLPKQDFIPQGYGSYSHGIACNYLFKQYIRNGGSKYFGLIDHDIFPVKPFDVSYYLEKQFFYGARHKFYIWPGLFFIRMDVLNKSNLDFRPSLWLHGDTGACNARKIFKNIDFSNYELIDEEHKKFGIGGDIIDNGYSYFSCGWIHSWNASNYMGKDMEYKMRMFFDVLEKKLL